MNKKIKKWIIIGIVVAIVLLMFLDNLKLMSRSDDGEKVYPVQKAE